MTETPHEKSKKKGKPGQKWGCFILLVKLVLAVFVIGHLMVCAYWSIMFGVYLVKYSHFKPHEVSVTCKLLDLPPESRFCVETNKQTSQTLEELLKDLYPIGLTTVQDLEKYFVDIECGLTTCSLDLTGPWGLMIMYEKDSNLITGYGVGRND